MLRKIEVIMEKNPNSDLQAVFSHEYVRAIFNNFTSFIKDIEIFLPLIREKLKSVYDKYDSLLELIITQLKPLLPSIE
jgi:hypothetical protein